MKTAEETYHGAKDALFAKVIELKDSHAWLGHPSVVARLDERLDKRCRKVVELGLQYEDRKQEWESEQEREMCSPKNECLDYFNRFVENPDVLHASVAQLPRSDWVRNGSERVRTCPPRFIIYKHFFAPTGYDWYDHAKEIMALI